MQRCDVWTKPMLSVISNKKQFSYPGQCFSLWSWYKSVKWHEKKKRSFRFGKMVSKLTIRCLGQLGPGTYLLFPISIGRNLYESELNSRFDSHWFSICSFTIACGYPGVLSGVVKRLCTETGLIGSHIMTTASWLICTNKCHWLITVSSFWTI